MNRVRAGSGLSRVDAVFAGDAIGLPVIVPGFGLDLFGVLFRAAVG